MTTEDHFRSVAIIGTGLLGGSLGMALRKRGLCEKVIGVGRTKERMQVALDLGAIDEYSLDLAEACGKADLIVCCTPVEKLIEDMPTVLKSARPDAIITDVGSVKSSIIEAAQGDPRFIGSHPMAGSENAGVEAANPDLFVGKPWAITPVASSSNRAIAASRSIGSAIGSVVYMMAPDQHDQIVAVISHLPHIMATALARLAYDDAVRNPDVVRMAAGSFTSATRVASSPAAIWRDICLTNKQPILDSINGYIEQLKDIRARIESDEADDIYDYFAKGVEIKKNWNA